MRFLLILMIIGSWTNVVHSADGGVLCIAKTPLVTPYIKYYDAKASTCLGCIFPSQAPTKDTYVHVVQTDNPDGEIVELSLIVGREVTSNQPQKVVVVLSTKLDTRVTFAIGDVQWMKNLSFIFVVTGYNEIHTRDLSHKIVYRKDWHSATVLSKSKNEFRSITSFTGASESNRIELDVGLDFIAHQSPTCSKDTTDKNPLALCTYVSPQVMAGCFHEDRIGSDHNDVHIIDVDRSGSNSSLLLMLNGLPSVGVTQRQYSPDTRNILNKNLTLVLRSKTPTSWTIRVSNLEGLITLLVGGNDQVENTSSPSQNLSMTVKKVELPSSFDQLMLHVLADFGPPVSYTRSKGPAIIKMFIPPKLDYRQLTQTRNEHHSSRSNRENANSLIQQSAVVDCRDEMAEVSLPLSVVRKVGGVILSLKDPRCTTSQNYTHLFIRSSYSECGFLPQLYPQGTIYTNFAYFEVDQSNNFVSDDEDFEGSGYGDDTDKIPSLLVKCKSSISRMAPGYRPESYKYEMNLFHDESLEIRYIKEDLPLVVPINGLVHAKIDFQAPQYLPYDKINLLIEECSLVDSPSYIKNSMMLIKKSCTVQPFVSLDENVRSRSLGIHFAVSDDIPWDVFYLHCEVGVCTSSSLPRPSVNKCVDPDSYCGKQDLMNIFLNQVISSLPQTVSVGPIEKQTSSQASTLEGLYSGPVFGHNQYKLSTKHKSSLLGSGDKAPIIVVEGLSTEAVVGISIASFVIGVGLMATLWFIYMKTDPRRQRRPESGVPRNSAYDIPGNSGSSTPSSQAPMTA